MNRRRTIILLCTLVPLLFLGCQTYTASKGKAIIEPVPSLVEGKIITKYSVLEEEKAQKLRQEQTALALVQQQEREARLATLTLKEQELTSALAILDTRLKGATEENQQLLDSLSALTLEKEQIVVGKQQYSQETSAQIDELAEHNTQLSNEIFELQNLIEENKMLQQEQRAERLRIENEQAALLAEQQTQQEAEWQALNTERDSLETENRLLKAQLEEKTMTIEEKVRLENERSDETKRLEQERLSIRQAQEAEQMRIASLEDAKRAALEEEWRQIPPLAQIVYPRLYKTDKPTMLASEGEKLLALMLPLSDAPWKDSTIASEVHKSISDLNVPIIFITGHMENVITLVKEMRSNAALFSTGAIITSFPILEVTNFGVEIQYQEKKNLRLVLANLPEYQVVGAFASGGAWQALQKSVTQTRLSRLKNMLGEGSLTVPTLMGASLYEPSYRDWNTFSPVVYRQVDYLWPLSDFLENEGFYDTFRLTHFSEATSAGNTLITPDWGERVDFIFSRKILPLESTMLTIGGESAPDASGYSRFGVLGSFLVP